MQQLLVFLISFLFLYSSCLAQQAKITSVKPNYLEKNIEIKYIINEKISGTKYLVEVYSSIDDYSSPLYGTKGNIGNNIQAGKHSIKWNYYDDVSTYISVVTVKIKLTEQFVPVVWKSQSIPKIQKLNKTYELQWEGGVRKE